MPVVKPLSEFNRNQSAMLEELHESGQPVYLTRNGTAEVVVMDAAAFDREISYRASARANEMRVFDSLMKGYADIADGKVVDADEAEERIRAARGWA